MPCKSILRVFLTLGVMVLALVTPSLLQAQSPIIVRVQELEMNFPTSMRFTLQASSDAPIELARLTVWQRGVALGSRFAPPITRAPEVRASFLWNFQSFGSGGYMPPGTRGEYTWHIEDAAGNVFDTRRTEFVVQDKTQPWRVLSNDKVRVSWHNGDEAFGQAVFERALSAREFFANELRLENVDPLEIFIYADKQSFFESLPPYSAEWTGGRMFPEFGVIMINFAPDNLEWGLRATSHELSHAILHAKIRGTIGGLSVPHWLDEGLAVYNETDRHEPDSQFEEAFQRAVRQNRLILLRSIQLQFPDDSEQAQLAYGQSYNVVRFMIDEYGKEKFAELLDVYQAGTSPDEGLVRVYGMNQGELENAWRRNLGVPEREVASTGLPTIGPRPTFEFSSPLSETPTAAAVSEPTAVPTIVSLVETPVPANSIPAPAPEVPTSGLCGGALALSGLVGFSLLKRRRHRL